MKKTMISVLALLFVLCFATAGFAAEKAAAAKPAAEKATVEKAAPEKTATPEAAKTEVFTGKIASIDTTKNEIVVKDEKAKVEKTIAVDAKEIGKLKVGKTVKVVLKVGTNTAEKITVVKAKAKKAKAAK